MEQFRKTLQRRLLSARLYCAFVALLILGGLIIGNFHPIPEFMAGFDIGLCIGVEFVMLYFMRQYQAALNDEEKLRKLYISETDERNRYIQTRIGGVGLNILMGALAAGTIVSGYFNLTVFVTLLCTLLFTSLMKLALKLYFHKIV